MSFWKFIVVFWILSVLFKAEIRPAQRIQTLNFNEYQGKITEPISTTPADESPSVIEPDTEFSKTSYIDECIAVTQKREVCREQGEDIFNGVTTGSFANNAEHDGSYILHAGNN
jgi:hypothetical protein